MIVGHVPTEGLSWLRDAANALQKEPEVTFSSPSVDIGIWNIGYMEKKTTCYSIPLFPLFLFILVQHF